MKVCVFHRPLTFFLFIPLFCHLANTQQPYLNNKQLNCYKSSTITNGYTCNGPKKSCKSFVTFRSFLPYDSPVSIAYLLGSEASDIALINKISDIDKIPPDTLIIVPISCSCSSGNLYYQHNTLYTIKYANETYFTIANYTYQGLTTCQALMSQNSYLYTNLSVGLDLMVPVRCACPSETQAQNGVTSLMTYIIKWSDTVTSISHELSSSIRDVSGVSVHSIVEANELSENSLIYSFTPILIPLTSDSCTIKPGNNFCYCANGYRADGRREGRICISDDKGFPVKLVTLLGLSIGGGLLCIFLCTYWLYKYLKKRKHLKRKQNLFKQNGGLLLQQQLSSYKGGVEIAKIFTAEELQRATDNYNQIRVLGQGGYGTVYKAMLPDGRIVAVKKSKAVDSSRIKQFINEVAILSQINHRNVVKLLGCCLETEVPLLVYEFVQNGTLSYHIHSHRQDNEESSLPLSWASRLRIASEVAGALSYMHSCASVPILHRDIKSSNILLDDQFNAKVSDFGTSRTIPFGETHLTTTVQGTFGYLDPEYFQTSQFSEKSDVYSFGVVLVELLTSGKPINFARPEEEINLVAHFISVMNDNVKLLEIIDPRVAKEGKSGEIIGISNLAYRCLRLEGKGRPTMKEVAMEIEGLRKNQKNFQINQEPDLLKANEDQSFIHISDGSGQESLEILSMEMESSSINNLA